MIGNFFFDSMFTIVPLLMIGMIILFISTAIKERRYNNSQPKVPVEAKIISKRVNTETRKDIHNTGNDINGGQHFHSTSTSTNYYITFEFINGERLELEVLGHEFGILLEGDKGILTFQGRRYISFQRQ